MKILTTSTLALTVLLTSCGSPKTEPSKKTENSNSTSTEVASKSGEDIFTSNGCVACHQKDAKTVGPSLIEIATAYSGNKDGLNKFLKGEGPAIVDPAQEAVMQPQTELTKVMSDDERSALSDYILKQ